jgi:glutamine amidotransferase
LACEQAGLRAGVTTDRSKVLKSDIVILPGVGAFREAMEALRRSDLVGPLRQIAADGKPLVGICLGMQLLFERSSEFGDCRGLGLFEGEVVRLVSPGSSSHRFKVPHIGWSCVQRPEGKPDAWRNTPLEHLSDGQGMYFVHSYHALPADPSVVLATTPFGHGQFCSAVRRGNIWGVQFHPERSGPAGLEVYRRLTRLLDRPGTEPIKSLTSLIR